MSNRRTEESVRRAFGNAAPNNLKEVMGKCEEQKGRVIILENTAKKKSGRVFSRVMAAAALPTVRDRESSRAGSKLESPG